ncbi:MAG TPA: Ig-like domain repeat protein [Herpetosiphonaceae bacterium]
MRTSAHRSVVRLARAALVGLMLSSLGLSAARPAAAAPPLSPQALSSAAIPVSPAPAAPIDGLALGQAGPVAVMIEFSAPPAVSVYIDQGKRGRPEAEIARATQLQAAAVERAQQPVIARIDQLGGEVLYSTRRVYSGVAARMDSAALGELASLPGVKAIHKLEEHAQDHTFSVPLIGAPQAWQNPTQSITGNGVSIAVIDTGIDYIHTDFGGAGTPAAYAANNTRVITDSAGYPSAKVVGGYDFAGEAYNAAAPATSIPNPDPDPMDCVTDATASHHGSHVAGTAAGYGVNGNGTTYAGAYGPDAPFSSMRIGPGVAPGAELYALRVFGCQGSTNLTTQAIDWAMDPNGDNDLSDHVDVINMSLGSLFGIGYDSSAAASDNAAAAGVIVVTSAGNSGDTYYISGSPGSATRAIATAATVDSGDIYDGFRVNSPAGIAGAYPGTNGQSYSWVGKPPITHTLVYPSSQASACAAFTPANQALINGNIVLIDWTKIGGANECGSAVRANNATAAGARGVIMAYSDPIIDIAIAGNAAIPSTLTSLAIGNQLKAALAGGPVSVTMSGEYISTQPYVDQSRVDSVAVFSSRGPRRGDSALKPDLAAPGQTTFSADGASGNRGSNKNGTSMAAPHVAGMMALLRQRHPAWTVEELKALAINTATNDIRALIDPTSPVYGPSRIGAGRVDVPQAVGGYPISPSATNHEVIAYNDSVPGAVSVSFGDLEVVGAMTVNKTVRVVNKGATAATYDLSFVTRAALPGVNFSVSPSSVTLQPGANATVTITLNADASQMKHTRDPALATTQNALARHWISEAGGFVQLTPAGSAARRLRASLRAGNEVPPPANAPAAVGSFQALFYPGTRLLTMIFDAKGLTGSITAAHLHRGAAGANGPVAYDIAFNPDGSQTGGVIQIDAADVPALLSGGFYANVHTAANTGGEIRGQVLVADTLRVPALAVARPASAMHAGVSRINAGAGLTLTTGLTLTGQTVNTGANFPLDELARVSALELQYQSPRLGTSPISASADLQYVGVASDARATGGISTTTKLYFGLATHGDWSSPTNLDTLFTVYIDNNRDGTPDYAIQNYNYGRHLLSTNDPTDTFITRVYRNNAGTFVVISSTAAAAQQYLNGVPASAYNTAPFNSNVMVLPALATQVGVTAASPRFNYWVETTNREATGVVELTPAMTFDAASPGIDTTSGAQGAPIYSDLAATTIPLRYNRSSFVTNASLGVLLLHHHNASGARADAVRVVPAPTINLSSSINPSTFGQNVTFTATAVSGLAAPVTGTVTFKDGAATIGTGTLSGGVATFSTSALSIGSHAITAVYGGNQNYGDAASAPLTQNVIMASSTTTLISGANPSVAGQNVTFTASVAPAAATGTVLFKDGAATIGTGTLSGGVATFSTSALSVGSHTITAVYGGDAGTTGSTSGAVTQIVNKIPTTLAASQPNGPAVYGQATIVRVLVTPGTNPGNLPISGTVTLRNAGGQVVGTMPVGVSGTVDFLLNALPAGTHAFQAAFTGVNFADSQGSVTVTVNRASTTTALAVSSMGPRIGETVTFTATVAAVAPGAGVVTGTVLFKEGATVLGTGTLVNGVATFSTAALAEGHHMIAAEYAATPNFAASASAEAMVMVERLRLFLPLLARPSGTR